jgi:AraC family transcriptional regulator of adaptative response / DNA-3-methyladenine glycosylase II
VTSRSPTTRVAVDADFDWPAMLTYFASRAIRGVEAVGGDRYHRVTPTGGLVTVRRTPAAVEAAGGSRPAVVRLLGLDGDHSRALEALRDDPLVGPRVRSRPGLRVPGTWDPFETGVRAIVGQQVSVAGAGTVAARLVARHGTPVATGADHGLTHAFPPPAVLSEADLDGLGLTGGRVTAIRSWSAAVAGGAVRLDGSPSLGDLVESIVALRGLGPWTAHYVALRVGYADAFPAEDLGLQRAAGLDRAALVAAAEAWRPYRALAAVHLWETPAPTSPGRSRSPRT